MRIATEGQAESFFHSKFLRIEHDGTNHKKRCLTNKDVLELFDGEVIVEEKIDGKPKATEMPRYHPEPKEYWIAEVIYPKNSVHDHVLKYQSAPHHVWLGRVIETDTDVNHPRLKVWACPVRDMGNRLTRRLR